MENKPIVWEKNGMEAKCGINVINMKRFDVDLSPADRIKFENNLNEVYGRQLKLADIDTGDVEDMEEVE